MNKLVILALIALFAVSAAIVPKGFGGRRWYFDEEEEADNKIWDWLKQRSNQDKLRDWAEKGVKTYDIWRKDEDEEESDAEFKINWKKIGEVAKNIGKSYLSSKYGINLDEAEEEADSEFIKINWKKIGNIAKDIGKTYLSSKYGINLDEEEESDFINWKKVWGTAKDIGKNYLSSKYGINLDEAEEESDQNRSFDFGANVNNGNWNVNGAFNGQTRNGGSYNVGGNFGNGGQWGVNGGYERSWNNGNTNFGGNVGYGSGGFNAGVKFTHRFDDIEEADFINWKKVWGTAKDIGKTYLSSKYGINLDEQEESDSEFIKINWKKIGNIAKDIGKTYLSSKYGINLDDAEDDE